MILYDNQTIDLDTIKKVLTSVRIIHAIGSDNVPVAWYSDYIAETTKMKSATVHVLAHSVVLDDGINVSYIIPVKYTSNDSIACPNNDIGGKYAKLRGR